MIPVATVEQAGFKKTAEKKWIKDTTCPAVTTLQERLPKCTVMPDKNYMTHKNDTLCNDNRCMVEQIIRAIYELDRTFH